MTSPSQTAVQRPQGRPFTYEINWKLAGIVGASVAFGALVGAGIALLTAPQSGAHTRLALAKEVRRRRPWKRSPWDHLGDELATLVRKKNRRLKASERV